MYLIHSVINEIVYIFLKSSVYVEITALLSSESTQWAPVGTI